MDWKIFWVTFGTVFLAEMGDKTQLAALTMTAETRLPWSVLGGACAALCLATVIGVAVGGVIGHYLPTHLIKKIAGLAFVVIGVLIFLGKF